MKRALVHAYEMAGEGTEGGERAALGVVRAALAADSAYETAGSPRADTLRAHLLDKHGYLSWRLRDKPGSLRAYASIWSRENAPLPDSLGAESLRSAGFVVVDPALGPVSRADTLASIRFNRRCITWALDRGENEVAASCAECLSLLLLGFDGDASMPGMSDPDENSLPLVLLLSIALGVALIWAAWEHWNGREERETVVSVRDHLGAGQGVYQATEGASGGSPGSGGTG